jgi:hypothetical protein
MIIDVTVLRKYSNSFDKKWINIFDPLFVPNKDYIEIEYEYSDKDNQENNLKKLMDKVQYVYDKFEKDSDLYKKIVKRGNEKGLLINDNTIQEISFNIISKYASNMNNTMPYSNFLSKYNTFDYVKLNGKYGKIGQIEFKQVGKGVQGSAYLCTDHKNKFKWITKITRLNFGKYDSYREMHFSEMTNKIVQYGGFVEYYNTKLINNTVYMSMEACEGDLINWSTHNRSEEDWISLIYQIVIAVNRLQKLKIIHNDLQSKNILFNNKVSTMMYKIGNNKYSFKSKFNFYIIDFGISAHPDLEINLISKEQMKRPNYDMKKFSRIPEKLKAINITKKYSYDNLLNKLEELKDREYKNKLKRLEDKVKDWYMSKEEKKEYIHLHMAYYYVKRDYFKDEYMVGTPLKMPNKITDMFTELRNWTTSLDDWLLKHMRKL